MTGEPEHHADRSSDQVWDALALIRETLEELLPPGWVRPAEETPRTVSAELAAIEAAIRAMAAVIPPERLTERLV